jgi:hypothetical protein
MRVEFVPFNPAHRHAEHLLSILNYANILASDKHFIAAMNLLASDPQIQLDLDSSLIIQFEITYDMRGRESDTYAATISKDRVILNELLFDRIGFIKSTKEANLIKVFLSFALAAHEVGHLIVRHNLAEEKQEYRMTPEKFNVPFVSGGKEAGILKI